MKRHLLLAAFAVATLTSAHAQSLTYYTNVRAGVDGDFHEIIEYNNPDLLTASVSGPTGNSTASARIAPGVNSTYAHWDSLDELNPSSMLIADAWTHWTDTVLISDPLLDGTIGHFTASLRVFGSASFALTGGYTSGEPYLMGGVYGFWDSWIGTSTDNGGSFLVGGWFGDWVSDDEGQVWYSGDELNQPMTDVELEFIYGQPFLLRTNMESYMDAQNTELLPGTVDATLDFSHTSYWNGISGFTDSQGNATNPSFWSQSGTDWRNPVPEPATILAMSLGFAGVWRRRAKAA